MIYDWRRGCPGQPYADRRLRMLENSPNIIGDIRALIVDKEPPIRRALADAMATRKDIDGFDSADNAAEALDKLQKEHYDVLILDISILEMSGAELVDYLKKPDKSMPAVIFVTAHRRQVITAIEKHVVDYVLKPFSNQRIHEALNMAVRRKANERVGSLAETMPQSGAVPGKPSKIAMVLEGRVLLIDAAEVIAVEAQGNYVLVVRSSESHSVRGSISTLAEKLQSYGFIQIHRSVLVNVSCVQGIHPRATGEYLLCTTGGRQYPVSRTYKQNLRRLAPLWIGSESLFAE